LPLYLTERFGFDIKQIGIFAWVPYVGGAIGALAGGALAGRLINKGWTVDKTRKTIIVVGGIFMFAPLYLTMITSSPLQAVILIAIVLFGFQFAMTNIQTLISDYFTGKSVGTVMGLSGTSSTIGVLLFTQLVPIITRTSYVPFFILIALIIPLGILSVMILGRTSRI
jgi:ACS family hexuronate transporter-like MFS transporter